MTFFWLAAMPRYHGLHVHNEDVPRPALANFSLDVCLARLLLSSRSFQRLLEAHGCPRDYLESLGRFTQI